jgi:hypothetical protein
MFHQYSALSIHRLAPDARASLMDQAEQSLAELRRLAEHCPANFAHRVALVEGESHRADGDTAAAMASYREAISMAESAGWINDVALGHELAARCSGEPAHEQAARDAYQRWGALAKSYG